jgi:hypothetical protein
MNANLEANGIHQLCYPNGKPNIEYTVKNGKREGPYRRWNSNGILEEECHYVNGLQHGDWKHWNNQGKLMGVDIFKRGSGLSRRWHANGQLSSETSYVEGEETGRMRYWDTDGLLFGTKYFFKGRLISKKKYLELCDADPSLPRFLEEKPINTLGGYVRKLRKERRESAKLGPAPEQIQAIQYWDSECELEAKEANSCEAIKWLTKTKRSVRELGELNKKEALNLVRKLYLAGAVKVWALRIEEDGDGAEHSKMLLIKLTKDPKQTGKLHKLCADPAHPYMDGSGPAIKVGHKFMTVSLL